MSNHTFDTEFAARYGIEESIIFGNIYHWCIYNKENNINLQKGKDGVERYYTFNSIASIQSQYNYIALSKVYRVIKKLEDEGLIITGCFNRRPGDKTRWYSVTQKGEQIYLECCNTAQSKLYSKAEISNCNLQNETEKLQNEMHNLQNETEKLQNETTLPNINTNIDSDINKFNSTKGAEKKKTKSQIQSEKMNEYLNSIPELDNCVFQDCVSELFEFKKRNDPNYNRTSIQLLQWQFEFAMFAKNSGRTSTEIKSTLHYALTTDYWSKFMFKPLNFTRNYESIFQQMKLSEYKQSPGIYKNFDKSSLDGKDFFAN